MAKVVNVYTKSISLDVFNLDDVLVENLLTQSYSRPKEIDFLSKFKVVSSLDNIVEINIEYKDETSVYNEFLEIHYLKLIFLELIMKMLK